MKRTFILFFLFLTALYAKQGYDILTSDGTKTCLLSGYLSDIAEEVIAIPLQKSKEYNIRYAKQVRKEGDNLFLVCNETLYRFNRKGELINIVTDPEEIKVGGYIIDNRTQQLIVLGNEDDIHYYSFRGELLEKKKLKNNISGDHIYSMAMHNNNIWTTEECITHNPDTNETCIEMLAVKYDTSFNKLETRKITSVETGRPQELTNHYNSSFRVNKDSGIMYLYNPPLSAENLLIDTLYIMHHANSSYAYQQMTAYPTQMNSRFWLAACENNPDPLNNYLFCYDTHKNQSWQLTNGFTDDYYFTGNVTDLHALDIYNQNYYFCKSGAEVKDTFSQSAKENNLVVFIVKLKA